ncbi:hypothetical protein FGO68_gene11881 [Halteria grandinella]|uniref:Uncharacterized protein n=1 Tax=Halteria grandinella TaxID=5974 RepID=A0A8J8NY36_HALGN|nr:hypothetical protein FGO68_gene11881 [Halteria grandinella]
MEEFGQTEFAVPESEQFEQSNHFLSDTKNALQLCLQFYDLLDNVSFKARNEVRKLEQQVQAMIINYYCQNETNCGNMALLQRDQSQYISEATGVIKGIQEQVQSMNEQFQAINDHIQRVNPQRKNPNAKIPRNEQNLDLKFQQISLTQLEKEQSQYRFVSAGPYFSISDIQTGSCLFRLDENQNLTHFLTLPFEVRLLAATDDNQLAINDQLYNLNDLSCYQSLNIPIENYTCVYHSNNILYYGYIDYAKIKMIDCKSLKLKCLRTTIGKCKGPGIPQIEGLKGLSEQLLFLYKGVVRKITVQQDRLSQQCEIVFKLQEEIVKFLVLPDNIHLVAITAKNNIFTANHLTGAIIQKVQLQETLSQIIVHPNFDFERFPVILGSSENCVQAMDFLDSGIQFTNMLEGARIVAYFQNGMFLIQQGSNLIFLSEAGVSNY